MKFDASCNLVSSVWYSILESTKFSRRKMGCMDGIAKFAHRCGVEERLFRILNESLEDLLGSARQFEAIVVTRLQVMPNNRT